MKKILALLMIAVAMITAAGCGGGTTDIVLVADDVISPAAIYSMAINVVQNASDYVGKSVQAEGSIHSSSDSSTGYYIRISDGTGCCAVDMEFKLADGLEYPEELTYIRISGVISSYKNDAGTEIIRIDANSILDQEELEKLYEE